MKKLLTAVTVLAMALSILPMAEASDTAGLSVKVTFDQGLRIWSDPKGPFEVKEAHELRVSIIAEDPDTEDIEYLRALNLPENSVFYAGDGPEIWPRPKRQKLVGRFSFVPDLEQAGNYTVKFEAKNAEGDIAAFEIGITVTEAVMAVKLVDLTGEREVSSWGIRNIKLGEKRDNLTEEGKAEIRIKNDGDADFFAYIAHQMLKMPGAIQPGEKQEIDRYTMETKREGSANFITLPLSGKVLISTVAEGKTRDLPLRYGAPIGLSEPVSGHSGGLSVVVEALMPRPTPMPQ